MATQTVLFASSRHALPFGLVLAGVILFVVSVGGAGALATTYTSEVAQALIAG
jgi:hypothetical protein